MREVSYFLPRSRLHIRGFEQHPKASTLTLALHGWLDNCYSFKPLSQHLDAIHLLSIDLPGHGNSDRIPVGQSYDFHQYLVWLYELQVACGAEKIRLIGHSMGAAIASLYSGLFPEKVEALVMIDGLGPLSVPDDDAPRRMRMHIEGWVHHKHDQNSVFTSFEKAIDVRQKAGTMLRESARALAERGTKSINGQITWKHDPRLKLPSRYQFTQSQVLSYFRQISCPSLFLQASHSILPKNELVKERIQAIADLRHIVLEGNHHCHLDAPKETARLICDFFTPL